MVVRPSIVALRRVNKRLMYGAMRLPTWHSNLYNSALAFAILLSLAFFTSCAFDCLDLARTKVSPRHRQQRLTDFESRTAIV